MYPLTLGLVVGTKQLWDELQACIRELPVRVLLEQTSIGNWADFENKLEQTKPDLLVLDLAELGEPLEAVIARIRRVSSPPVVAAAHPEATPDLVMEAVRAGAGEFLYAPVRKSLLNALTRISDEREQRSGTARRGGKIVSFVSSKGGCGATTLASYIGIELAHQTQQPTLLADLDLEAGMLGFVMKSQSEYSLLDAVRNVHRLDLSFWKKLVSNGVPHVEIIAASPALSASDEITPQSLKAIAALIRSHYEWSVMDLGRGLSRLTLNALEIVDQAFLVTTMEVPALHRAKEMIQRLLGSGFARDNLRLIINRMPKNADLTVEEVEKALGHQVYATVPNDYLPLYESYSEGTLLNENTLLRRHLAQVARRIGGLQERQTKKRFSLFG